MPTTPIPVVANKPTPTTLVHPSSPHASHKAKNLERNIDHIVLGDILCKTWFHSFYPEDLLGGKKTADRLYICQHCFRYTIDVSAHLVHQRCCSLRDSGPPGTKIYDYDGYMVWEVDGEEDVLFAQNLSLFAKLFLENKSVFFDVSSFLYYILTYTESGRESDCTILGFFSKEKQSWDLNNLACILIFPPYQHRQLGKLLMGISYKLSAWEWEGGVIGGPEKPLSEMGRRSYTRFWEERIARYLMKGPEAEAQKRPPGKMLARRSRPKKRRRKVPQEEMSVRDISHGTGMLVEDVVAALTGMGILEPAKPSKKQARKVRDEAQGNVQTMNVVVRKQTILDWVKANGIDLKDPVREEGFLGEWAPEGDDEDEDGSNEEEDEEEDEEEEDDG